MTATTIGTSLVPKLQAEMKARKAAIHSEFISALAENQAAVDMLEESTNELIDLARKLGMTVEVENGLVNTNPEKEVKKPAKAKRRKRRTNKSHGRTGKELVMVELEGIRDDGRIAAPAIAKKYGVNPTSINKAIQQLAAEKVIEEAGKGPKNLKLYKLHSTEVAEQAMKETRLHVSTTNPANGDEKRQLANGEREVVHSTASPKG